VEILIAEDEEVIANSLKKHLLDEGHHVVIAFDGESAMELARRNEFDMILLDWRMPKKTGIEVCKLLRSSGVKTPIILLTALNEISNKVEALNLGADDYITKPFSFEEVLARMNAVIRRYNDAVPVLTFQQFTMDLFARTLYANDVHVRLTNKEYDLLYFFLRHKNSIISKEKLAQEVWEVPEIPLSNIIEATVKNLRKRLEEHSPKSFIKTIYGEGYVFTAE
jgi:DNA-binding response OmpR family regulator